MDDPAPTGPAPAETPAADLPEVLLDPDGPAVQARLAGRIRLQAHASGELGSTLYAELLGRAADDVADGGPCWAVLEPFADADEGAAVPLRFMAAVHRLVLRRQAPELALHYPSVGGEAGLHGAWDAFVAAVRTNVDLLRELTALPCQTNEVGRSAALAPGLLWAQARHDLPIDHLEVGASAGLNLRWDAFRYATARGGVAWGDPDSPVDLRGHWEVPPTGLPATAEVVRRRGCDPMPGDVGDQATRETLTASVWADQPERMDRLRGAMALAARIPAPVDAEHAGTWLPRVLADRPADAVTVVTHSVVWRYLEPAERDRVTAALQSHGAEATARNPLVWLRLEPRPPLFTHDGTAYPITATTWPGGHTVELGTAQAHGQEVRWHGTPG